MINYSVGKHYRVKEQKSYPWPCKPIPDRTVELFPDDILTKSDNGTFTKHTGICMLGIKIPDCDVEEFAGPIKLVGA